MRSRQSVQTSRESAESNTSFLVKFSAQVLLSLSSEFTFGDNSDKLSIFQIFMNLVDRDLTEYQITLTLTLSRLHASSGADKGNQIVHTHATC